MKINQKNKARKSSATKSTKKATRKRPAMTQAIIDGGKQKAEKAAPPKSKGGKKAAPKKAKADDSGARIPKVCYRHDRVFEAGLRHCRNDEGKAADLWATSKKSEMIKAGNIVEGVHGYRVSRTALEGIGGKVVAFKANCKVTVNGKQVPAMEKKNPKGQQAGFGVAKVGGKVQNVTFRPKAWLAERGLEAEACEYVG